MMSKKPFEAPTPVHDRLNRVFQVHTEQPQRVIDDPVRG
jgi:hypothetical protein